jgi:hypothetical protein
MAHTLHQQKLLEIVIPNIRSSASKHSIGATFFHTENVLKECPIIEAPTHGNQHLDKFSIEF